MELVNDASTIVGDVLTYPVWQHTLCPSLVVVVRQESERLYPPCPFLPSLRRLTTNDKRQLTETLASGEAATLVEEGLWDMAREVVRAYEAGEMPKGEEGACFFGFWGRKEGAVVDACHC